MKKIFFVAVIGLFITSCADFKKDQQLQRVKKLTTQLNRMEAQLKDGRLKEVATIKNNTMQTELRIKQNLHLDTVDMELARKLDAYKLMRKSIKPLMQQFVKVRSGIQEEKEVLQKLATDIKEGRGERDKYPEYIQFERQKVGQLDALTKDYMRSKDKFFKEYNRLYPMINAFANSLIEQH